MRYELEPLPVDVFVVAGPPGAGKSAFCDWAQDRGYGLHFQVSDMLREVAAHDDRATLGEVADRMGSEYGSDIWEHLAVEYWLPWRREFNRVFVNGPRRPHEIQAALRLGADICYLEADEATCAARLERQAAAEGRPFDRQAFLDRSRAERHGRTSGGEDGIHTDRIPQMAGVLLVDNSVEIPSMAWADRPRPRRSTFIV